ncbi:MAG: 50S ribosomal protein L29 [Bacteriovoracaceae bacterium]|nr:50S ribosomal protein L29 [Bacteriovoracaceae bacterium]
MLKMSEIKDWEGNVLDKKVTELRVELFNINMQKTTSGIEKPHRIKEIKKDIARLLTVKSAKVGR